VPGGFAEYCRYPARHVTAIGDLPALEAVLIEPAACATHGIERMAPKVGSTVLLFGCGPTGMLLAQLLKLNGTANVWSFVYLSVRHLTDALGSSRSHQNLVQS